MVCLKRNLSFLILVCSGKFTEGARVASVAQDLTVEETKWGRSCESLETRFNNQQIRLAESDGSTALIRSVSLMRTLRRANARDCEWLTNGEVDTSVAAEMAARYFQQSPCYEEARGAVTRAKSLPEEEVESGMLLAVEILLTDNEECVPPSMVATPELNESEEMLESELDDDTDEVMEELAVSSGTSLIQQLPMSVAARSAFGSWIYLIGGGLPVIVAALVFGILLALFCRSLVHMLVRMFRWIRCNLSGNSCSEYSPAGWLQSLVSGGCDLAAILTGPMAGLNIGIALGR